MRLPWECTMCTYQPLLPPYFFSLGRTCCVGYGVISWSPTFFSFSFECDWLLQWARCLTSYLTTSVLLPPPQFFFLNCITQNDTKWSLSVNFWLQKVLLCTTIINITTSKYEGKMPIVAVQILLEYSRDTKFTSGLFWMPFSGYSRQNPLHL